MSTHVRYEEGQEFSFKSLFSPFTTLKAIHWIIFIGIVVYANSLFNNFIADDNGQILDNQMIHSIGNFFDFFKSSTFAGAGSAGIYYKPVFSIVLSFLYSFFGPTPFAFHSFQLVLHIANAILIFIFSQKFLKKYYAFFISILFLVHPINAESVIYISDLQEILFFFFGMLGLLLLASEKIDIKKLVCSGVLLLLSLFSKESGILFWLISFAYLIIYKKESIKNYFYVSLGVWTIYSFFRFILAGIYFNKDQINPIMYASLPERLLSIPAILHYYLYTFLFPVNLLFNQQWVVTQPSFQYFILPLFFDILFVLLLGLLIFFLIRFSRKAKSFLLFSSLWFFFGIILHLQIFPLDATVADRWFYFPIVGLLFIIGYGLQIFLPRITFPKKNILILLLGIAILVSLSLRTIVRNTNWQNPITFYIHDIQLMQPNFSLENALAFEYSKDSDYRDAFIHAKRSVDIFPTFVNYTNLGALYERKGDIKNAELSYQKAIQIDPLYYLAYQNLSLLLLKNKSPNEARDFIRKTTDKFPLGEKVWLYRIVVEYKTGNYNNALLASEKYYLLKKDSSSYDIYQRLSQKLPLNIVIK